MSETSAVSEAKERPIIFSTPMIRAILDGRKTQTRRVAKDPARCEWLDGMWTACPYGCVGDRLWVREAIYHCNGKWQQPNQEWIRYKATDKQPDADWPLRPSIHMPRWASRIALEIVEVRVERVQDITEVDAKAEGVHGEYPADRPPTAIFSGPYRAQFSRLWNSINAKRGFEWAKNPYVWVVSFRRINP